MISYFPHIMVIDVGIIAKATSELCRIDVGGLTQPHVTSVAKYIIQNGQDKVGNNLIKFFGHCVITKNIEQSCF